MMWREKGVGGVENVSKQKLMFGDERSGVQNSRETIKCAERKEEKEKGAKSFDCKGNVWRGRESVVRSSLEWR